MQIIGLKRYVETRWLSLGISLQRLLQIWPSLVKYMENPPLLVNENHKKKLLTYLKDNNFKLRVMFISKVLDKINRTNIEFQRQNLEIDQLPILINKIVKEIADLIIQASKVPNNLSELNDSEWNDNYEFLRDDDSLFTHLARELDLSPLLQLNDPEVKRELLKGFRNTLQLLLKKLLHYLPIQQELIQNLSFLSFDQNADEIKTRILSFNKAFSIFPEENKILLEINDLLKKNLNWMRRASKGSSLTLWNLIEQTYGNAFPCLSKIVRFVHSFAPSSANVEQSFSVLKLLKSDLRNSLKEKTLESLILLHEEFKNEKPIVISLSLIKKYDSMKKELNINKGRSRASLNFQTIERSQTIPEPTLDQSKLEGEMEQEISTKIEEKSNNSEQNMNNISGYLERSCVLEDHEEEKENHEMRDRQSKKSLYSKMIQYHESSPEDSANNNKLKKIKLTFNQ